MKRRLALSLAGGALLLGACGDGPDEPASTPTSAAAVRTAPAAASATKGPNRLENATTTASGLQYTDQVVGTGASPGAASEVTVHYAGKLASNGQVFDSSVQRGQPATFRMDGVIKGFSEGLSTMKVGGKRTVYIPAALGYGARGQGPVPANADLIFEIELLAVK